MVVKIAGCAGHGGYKSTSPQKVYATPGKRTPDGTPEWEFNNKVIVAFEDELKKYEGYEFRRYDDRTGKTDVPLTTRTNNANAWGATCYISFHHNANAGVWDTHTGVETYVQTGVTGEAIKLAEVIHPALVDAYDLRDRGVRTSNLHITRETKMPAVLVEGGFMDSITDIKKLRDNKVLEDAGRKIAQAVAKYYKLKKKANVTTTTKPATSKVVYRVRKSANDAASQKGAFTVLANAIAMAKDYDGYEVYDQDGKMVWSETKTTTTKPAETKPVGIKAVGTIKISGTKSGAAYICDKPSTNSKNLTTIKEGKTISISGSVPGWWEVIYDGKRAYVNAKFGKKI